MKKIVSIALSLMLVLTMSISAFAAEKVEVKEKDSLITWLQDTENTKFDYTDPTKPLNTDADWTAFIFARAGVSVDPAYLTYLPEAVKANAKRFYPSDNARVALVAVANGLDPKNLGGVDVIKALADYDYTGVTMLSSLYAPLLFMNASDDFEFANAKKQEIIDRLAAIQMTDGGFPFSTEDLYGTGVTSDMDTTAYVVQALAPFYLAQDAKAMHVVDLALEYMLSAPRAASGAFNNSFGGASGETTAQVVTALAALNMDPTGDTFKANGKTAIDGLKAFIDPATGGGFMQYNDWVTGDLITSVNVMSTWQILQGFVAYERIANGENSLYNLNAPAAPVVPNPAPVEPETETTTAAPQTEETTQNTENVDIPKTGAAGSVLPIVMTSALLGAAVLYLQKKHD